MVGRVNSFTNIVMIKLQTQWFWSKLETTSLEDTLIKLGKVRIFTNSSKFLISHNFPKVQRYENKDVCFKKTMVLKTEILYCC